VRMESGQGTLAALVPRLQEVDARAYVKVVFDADTKIAWHVDTIVAPPQEPANWHPEVWTYEALIFASAEVPVPVVAAALDSSVGALQLGDLSFVVPPLAEQFTWQRRPSRARFDSLVLPWPTSTCELRRSDNTQTPTAAGYLIGDDCPSFPSYQDAFPAFFYSETARAPGGQLPSETVVVRLVQAEAWIEQVVVTPVALEVHTSGSRARGARVELNSASYRVDGRVTETGCVRLPLPEGLPAEAFLYLSRDRDWLDYRPLGEYRSDADWARAGVEVEVAEDPQTEVQALLARGEGQQVEFKSQLPGDSAESKRTVFKTVAAFANGSGGNIVFGVEKDEATICGLSQIDPLRERDRLTQLVRSTVTPAPEIEASCYDLDGMTILVLSVETGASPPYGITLPGHKDKPVEFYVRRGATTFPARPEEIRGAVLATAPGYAPAQPWWSG
jgi:Putative DNA-binding domain